MLISVEQAAKRLRKTERTIRRWLSEGLLTPYHPSHGRKDKYLVDDNEVERLATELELEQPEPNTAASDQAQDTSSLELEQRIMTHLENKIAALESRIAACERLLSVGTPARIAAAATERPATRTYQKRAIEPIGLPERLPPGSIQHFEFADRHGVKPRTFLDHIKKGFVTSIPHEKPNRPGESSHWLSPEQQRAALLYWQANKTPFHACIIPACPCHAIVSGHDQDTSSSEQQLEQETP